MKCSESKQRTVSAIAERSTAFPKSMQAREIDRLRTYFNATSVRDDIGWLIEYIVCSAFLYVLYGIFSWTFPPLSISYCAFSSHTATPSYSIVQVAFSPWQANVFAVSSSQHFGMSGKGVQQVMTTSATNVLLSCLGRLLGISTIRSCSCSGNWRKIRGNRAIHFSICHLWLLFQRK